MILSSFKNNLIDQIVLEEFLPSSNVVNHLHTLPHNIDADVLYEHKEAQSFPRVRRVFRIVDHERLDRASDMDHIGQFNDSSSSIVNEANVDSPRFMIKRDGMEYWLLSDIIIHTINSFERNYHKCADFVIVDIQHAFPSAEIPKIALSVFIAMFQFIVYPFRNAFGPSLFAISNHLLYHAYKGHFGNLRSC